MILNNLRADKGELYGIFSKTNHTCSKITSHARMYRGISLWIRFRNVCLWSYWPLKYSARFFRIQNCSQSQFNKKLSNVCIELPSSRFAISFDSFTKRYSHETRAFRIPLPLHVLQFRNNRKNGMKCYIKLNARLFTKSNRSLSNMVSERVGIERASELWTFSWGK